MAADLAKLQRPSITLLSGALVLTIGAVDFWTGYDLSFGLFYTVPIFLLSWYVARPAAIAGSFLSAATWYLANGLTAPESLSQTVLLWNTAIRFGFFVAFAYPVAALREAYRREKASARTDPLTGVANSRAFHETAQMEVLRARRVGYPLTLLYLDLDGFKSINDNRGHAVGDELLRRIGFALKTALRETDLVGRLGGDEFAILLPNTPEQQAAAVIDKIDQSVARVAQEMDLMVGVSTGVASPHPLPTSLAEMIAMADDRMYRAKHSKRDEVQLLRM